MAAEAFGPLTRDLGSRLNLPIQWKELDWLGVCNIRVSGFPNRWSKEDLINGLFKRASFPTRGLTRIMRVLPDAMAGSSYSTEVPLVYRNPTY